MEDVGVKSTATTSATLNGCKASCSPQQQTMLLDIELLRDKETKSFGLQLQACPGQNGEAGKGCCVKKVMPYASTESIEEGDVVVGVDRTDALKWNYDRIVQEIRGIAADRLLLSVRRLVKAKSDDKTKDSDGASFDIANEKTVRSTSKKKRKVGTASSASLDQKSGACSTTDATTTTATNDSVPELPPMPPLPTESTELPTPPLATRTETLMQARPNENSNTDPSSGDGHSREKLFPNACVATQLKLVFKPARIKEGKITAKIKQNGTDVGTIVSDLVRYGPMFKESCENEHGDLELVADALFEEGGKPGCRELDERNAVKVNGQPKKRKRGRPKKEGNTYFLYIQELKIESKYRRDGASDIGSAAIRSFLTQEDIIKKWDVAAYIAHYQDYMPLDDDGDDEHSARHTDDDIAPEKWIQVEAEKRKWMSQDARQFIRVGFEELSEETTPKMGVLYITGEMLAKNQCRQIPFTHEEALSIKLRCDAAPDVAKYNIQVLDDKLRSVILHECDHHQLEIHQRSFQTLFARSQKSQYDDSTFVSTKLIPEIDKYISQGANVTRANALHAAAATQCIGLFVPLLDRGGDINSKDKDFMTPLMVAASVAGQKDDVIKSQFVIASLIALGANKNIKDKAGRTAIGHFYRTLNSMNNFASKHLGLPESPIDATIERLLTPTGGMTAADKRSSN